eukprot:g9864.t1
MSATKYGEATGDRYGSTRKRKKKDEVRQIQLMSDRMYVGPVKTSSIGEQFLEGQGSYHWEGAGILYEGPFKNSQIQGVGTCRWEDGRWYDGDFHEGWRHGEGFFFAADGGCRYKGSWVRGERHGYGTMVYAKEDEFHPILPKLKPRPSRTTGAALSLDDGGGGAGDVAQTPARKREEVDPDQYEKAFNCANYAAWYIGQWTNGLKHGTGMQQWRQGVVYDGHWAEGKMNGAGSMTWKELGRVNESYTGQWKDNLPDGEGSHIWEALNSSKNEVDKHTSQQMNNKYEGSWRAGKRHGYGVFFYANGAKYEGHWIDNLKHDDHGRFTFEDGSVYSGAFRNDTMVNPPRGKAAAKTTLNIGGEDNPVRLCIHIQDLVVFIKEDATRIVKDPLTGSYNLLLRYMSETKQMYLRYRKMLKSDDDDPYVLTLLQFWCFARDFRLITDSQTFDATMLFRHFLEGLIRVAVARYPFMTDLEKQLERLFKENIKPLLLVPSMSFATFDVLRAPEWKPILDLHKPKLWKVFCEMGNGASSFGDTPLALKDPMGSSTFVSNSRRAHVNGRQSVTITFKKVLQFLMDHGLLEKRLNLVPDLTTAVISFLLDDREEGDDELGVLRKSITRTQQHRGSLNFKEEKKQGLDALFAKATIDKPDLAKAERDRSECVEVTEEMTLAVVWRLKLQQHLECLMDVMHPNSINMLRWHVLNGSENIGILDFLETEMNFAEFILFLKEYSVQGCRNPDGTDILRGVLTEEKFDAFVKWILLPAVECGPYKSQAELAAEASPGDSAGPVEGENLPGADEAEEGEKEEEKPPEEEADEGDDAAQKIRPTL